MVDISLTNSRSHRKERFAPIDPARVRMYLCGPTVYDRAHLGNARPVVVFDVLYRLLRHVYGEGSVTYVRNFTDVDDKINARAAEAGRSIHDITDETIAWYHEDMDALGNLRPDFEPRATEYIAQMIAMIETLITRGNAYVASGHVLFDVRSYPAYGALSGRSVDDMIAGARVEVAPFKRDPMDFVLWKPSDAETPGWESPWGRGRPGWHIECSAMSEALLGPDFDIHAGGLDLLFPHHENEVAQSCCANPDHGFANFWLHNEMLLVDGKKMSKSLGNFFTVRDLLDAGVPGEVIRYVMLMTHYRKPMDWTAEKAREALDTLRSWAQVNSVFDASDVDPRVLGAVADDLNSPLALHYLHDLFVRDHYRALSASAALIGIDLKSISKASWASYFEIQGTNPETKPVVGDFVPLVSMGGWGVIDDKYSSVATSVATEWLRLRHEKRYSEADALKAKAAELGLQLRARKSALGSGAFVLLGDAGRVAELEGLIA
ncbi:cysteine--tRNA ligase [Paracoccus suum]|uniref:Cysteine--tRNA ligase n=1 Tax=Paracoccus suum TaxID=2259340 RepID=A0A344PM26_9RHOB|nr:cysteine--tRNA ligase [Paracoccus suum]AXC50431.1 cysteine--tRNA ligase [Paracoccus suum]